MKRLRDEYKIPDDWTQQDVYRVISVRYELELRSVDDIGLETTRWLRTSMQNRWPP